MTNSGSGFQYHVICIALRSAITLSVQTAALGIDWGEGWGDRGGGGGGVC